MAERKGVSGVSEKALITQCAEGEDVGGKIKGVVGKKGRGGIKASDLSERTPQGNEPLGRKKT